jgi:hypothetical protein
MLVDLSAIPNAADHATLLCHSKSAYGFGVTTASGRISVIANSTSGT